MTSPLPGRPVWLDLMTHDVAGATAFYSALFGWEFTDQGEEFGHYTLITKDGHQIGGMMSSLMSLHGPTSEPQAPTAWTVYLHSDNIEDALSGLTRVGGRAVLGPMDVADHGRQAYLMDPGGAHVGLWQPRTMRGFDLPLTPGTPVWFECMSKDIDAALPFYQDVLGWDVHWMTPGTVEPESDPVVRYATNGVDDTSCAGLCDAAAFLPPEASSFWRIYFSTTDAEATAARVQELGGTVVEAPTDSPYGTFAQVNDPQGATFMINQNARNAPGS